MHFPLFEKINKAPDVLTTDAVLDSFLEYVKEKNLTLYDAQEEAILELYNGQNVILNTPTGSGKSLVAAAFHFLSVSQKRRSYYTSPIKALVNEKFLSLCKDFGPEFVGMVTGDASVNPTAPIICCTAEVLANLALREGANANVSEVIVDEFHYYSDRERGVAWQIPLLALPQAHFLLMSATLGDTEFFEKSLTELNGRATKLISSQHRPVPLHFHYSEEPLLENLKDLVEQNKAPIYLVHFTQRECAEQAQNLMSTDYCTKVEKLAIGEALKNFKFNSPYGKELQRFLKHGIGIHHAGLLPKYRVLVETLAQKGLLKIICGTDTLGVGVNVPLRTVLFTKLCKFDGQKTGILAVRDFKQIAGRAGRKGFDDVGYVVAQAPEHVIENINLERKAAGDAKKLKKLVKRKPPDKRFVMWDKSIFERLISAEPEKLTSRFQISYGMLLNVLSREEDGCQAMRDLLKKCHETEVTKTQLRRLGFQMFRSLLQKNIIQFAPTPQNPKNLQVNVSLQNEFSLNHSLSVFLIDVLKPIDPFTETFVFDLLSLVESIVEDPDAILNKQRDFQRDLLNNELKASGVPFEERIDELDKVEYPKPNADFIYANFNEFIKIHPWLAGDNISPKSIVRDMYESFFSFDDYIRQYGLLRMEGVLLRYMSDVYKVLTQTVPEYSKTEAVYELESYLKGIIQSVDSSLLDEWERLKNPEAIVDSVYSDGNDFSKQTDITTDKKSFVVLIRNAVFQLLRSFSRGSFEDSLELLDSSRGPLYKEWSPETLKLEVQKYLDVHGQIRLDQDARRNSWCQIRLGPQNDFYEVEQTLIDSNEENDWILRVKVPIAASAERGKVVLILDQIEKI